LRAEGTTATEPEPYATAAGLAGETAAQIAANRRPMAAVIIAAIGQQTTNTKGAHFGERDFLGTAG